MILGQSIFDAVLDRLNEEAAEDEDGRSGFGVEAPRAGIRGLNPAFIHSTVGLPPEAGTGRLDDAYFDFVDDAIAPSTRPAERVEPDPQALRFSRLTPQDVAEDLKLAEAVSAERLQALRRSFARQNHPDMVGEAWREQATLRMKIANLLIDEALKRLPGASGATA